MRYREGLLDQYVGDRLILPPNLRERMSLSFRVREKIVNLLILIYAAKSGKGSRGNLMRGCTVLPQLRHRDNLLQLPGLQKPYIRVRLRPQPIYRVRYACQEETEEEISAIP